MPIQSCSASGCTTEQTSVVLDANWRWTHVTDGYTNCYTGNKWNATACPDGKTCAQNCAIDGADYSGTYGVSTPSSGALKLQFVTKNTDGTNVGSRLYLMASDEKYRMFNLLNKEFTFDVDVSNLPCGLNGAVYFSEMDEDGGLSKFDTNKAGAKYGTGYCDSQCPQDIKFINGEVGHSFLQLHLISNNNHRLMLRDGRELIVIRILGLADSALAALRWTSGRLI